MSIYEMNEQKIKKAETLMSEGNDREAEEILYRIEPASEEQERRVYQMLKAIRLGW